MTANTCTAIGPQSTVNAEITGEVTGSFRPAGLTIAGLITPVALNDSSWTKLPATPLANRNAIAVQNQTNFEMKIQYLSGSGGGYIGMIIPANTGERFYQITDTIEIYGRLTAGGSGTVIVEELS